MCKLKYIALSCYIVWCGIKSFHAQVAYSTDSHYFLKPSPYYFLGDTNLQKFQYPDTNVLHFQYVLPFYFNGQVGTAQPDYLLQNTDVEIGNRVLTTYYPDVVKLQDFEVWRTKGFFSKIEGIAGSKDEQHFRALFTSPIRSQQQVNFFIRRSTNTGFYQNQKGSITTLCADYHLYGQGRWSTDARFVVNVLKHRENGGIVNDTLSYKDLFLDKVLIPISLSDAKKNYQYHAAEYSIHYLIGKDTLRPQSLSLSVRGSQELFQYSDNNPLSGYYHFIFLDTVKTMDSLKSRRLEIPVFYSFRFKNSIVQLSYKYQRNAVYLHFDSIFQNHFLEGKTDTWFQFFRIHGHRGTEIKYVFSGTQKNNFYTKVFTELYYKKWTSELTASVYQQSPSFQQNFWYSNHFIWYNRFKNILSSSLHFRVSYDPYLRFSYKVWDIQNFVYFQDNYPSQYTTHLFIHQGQLSVNVLFWKHLGIKGVYYYQWKSARVIALPEHLVHADVYYQGRWFKKNLLVSTGLQFISALNYFDTYQYNPATAVYSVMLRDFQAGNYPQVGIYFSGRIKPVNFFIRLDNIFSGFVGQAYYYLPHYMMPDRAFKMGISWMFFD